MPKRQHDELYLRFLRRQPCCVCGDIVGVEAHHPRADVINGEGRVSDKWAVPLCAMHHRDALRNSEWLFWRSHNIDPLALALHYHANPDDDPIIASLKNVGRE